MYSIPLEFELLWKTSQYRLSVGPCIGLPVVHKVIKIIFSQSEQSLRSGYIIQLNQFLCVLFSNHNVNFEGGIYHQYVILHGICKERAIFYRTQSSLYIQFVPHSGPVILLNVANQKSDKILVCFEIVGDFRKLATSYWKCHAITYARIFVFR